MLKMSLLSSKIKTLFWSVFKIRQRHHYMTVCKTALGSKYNKIIAPPTFAFSIFTWLGFDNKLTPEDELILSIKHSVLFIQRNEYDKAERLLHVALRQAQQVQNQLGITYIYDVMANLALQRKQLDKAKSLFISVAQRLMADGVSEDDIRLVHISLKLARISHLKKEYDVAQIGYEWCIKKLEGVLKDDTKPDTVKLYAMAEDWYGRLYVDCNQNENGLKLLLSALNRMKQINDIEKEHIIIQLNDIGTVCEKMNRFDDSIEYLQEAISMSKGIEDMDDLGATYVNLGKVYIRMNMLDEARKSCGYGWRLGYERKNEEIKKEAKLCVNQINSLL